MKKIIISILSIAVILPTVLFLFVKAQNNNSVNFAEVNTDYNITLSKNEKNPFITDKNYKAANSADNDVNINITKIQDNSVTANGYILLDNKKVEYIATGEMDEYNINGKAAQKAALFGMLLDGKGTDMTISFASINSENKIAGSVIINSVIGNGTDNSKSMAFGEEFEEIYQIIQKDLEDTQEEIPDYVSKVDETSDSDVPEIDMGESSGESEYSMNTEKGMYVSQRSVSGYSWAFSDYYLYTGQDIPENRRNYIGVSIFYPKTVSSNLSYRAYMKLHCDDEVVKDYIKSKVNTGAYGFSFNDTICNLSFTVPNVNFGGYII